MQKCCTFIRRYGREYLVLLVLLSLHWLVISRPGRHAVLASSGAVTNLIRLESRASLPAGAVVLAGSSITGRLLGEYFSAPTGPVINLGLDGCGTLDAAGSLLPLDHGPAPRVVIFEVNTLEQFLTYEQSFTKVTNSYSPVRATAAAYLPWLAARERPVELLYDALHDLKFASHAAASQLTWNEAASVPGQPTTEPPDEVGRDYFARARKVFAALKAHHVQMALVLVPAERQPRPDNKFGSALLNAQMLGQEFSVPIFDLRQCAGQAALAFTDDVHLQPTSARAVCQIIEHDILPRLH